MQHGGTEAKDSGSRAAKHAPTDHQKQALSEMVAALPVLLPGLDRQQALETLVQMLSEERSGGAAPPAEHKPTEPLPTPAQGQAALDKSSVQNSLAANQPLLSSLRNLPIADVFSSLQCARAGSPSGHLHPAPSPTHMQSIPVQHTSSASSLHTLLQQSVHRNSLGNSLGHQFSHESTFGSQPLPPSDGLPPSYPSASILRSYGEPSQLQAMHRAFSTDGPHGLHNPPSCSSGLGAAPPGPFLVDSSSSLQSAPLGRLSADVSLLNVAAPATAPAPVHGNEVSAWATKSSPERRGPLPTSHESDSKRQRGHDGVVGCGPGSGGEGSGEGSDDVDDDECDTMRRHGHGSSKTRTVDIDWDTKMDQLRKYLNKNGRMPLSRGGVVQVPYHGLRVQIKLGVFCTQQKTAIRKLASGVRVRGMSIWRAKQLLALEPFCRSFARPDDVQVLRKVRTMVEDFDRRDTLCSREDTSTTTTGTNNAASMRNNSVSNVNGLGGGGGTGHEDDDNNSKRGDSSQVLDTAGILMSLATCAKQVNGGASAGGINTAAMFSAAAPHQVPSHSGAAGFNASAGFNAPTLLNGSLDGFIAHGGLHGPGAHLLANSDPCLAGMHGSSSFDRLPSSLNDLRVAAAAPGRPFSGGRLGAVGSNVQQQSDHARTLTTAQELLNSYHQAPGHAFGQPLMPHFVFSHLGTSNDQGARLACDLSAPFRGPADNKRS